MTGPRLRAAGAQVPDGGGRGTSSRCRTLVSPYLSRTIALIVPVVGSGPVVPPVAGDERASRRIAALHDLRRVDRSQPPTADQQPQREQQLTEECEHRDGGDLQR